MTGTSTRRCEGCTVANALAARYCRGCGVPLPPAPAAPEEGAPAERPLGAAFLAAVPYPLQRDLAERAWREVRGVAWLFLFLLAMTVAVFVAGQAGGPEAEINVAATMVVTALALVLTLRARKDVVPALLATGGPRGLLIAAATFLALLAFGHVYFGVCEHLGFPIVRVTDAHVAAGWPPWASYLLVALAPAITEELLFRGYVTSRLLRALTPNETLLVQAALFSVIHFGPVIFPSHFVIGVALGLVRRLSGSLYPAMAVHGAWNARVVWLELGRL